MEKHKETTHRNSHELPDLLDLVTRRKGLEALERRRQLLLGELALLGRPDLLGLLLGSAAKNNLVLVVVVLVEQSLLVVHRTRRNLHLQRMLLGVLLHLLEVLVVAVLGEPGNDITRRPVDLEGVGVLVVDVVLQI